MRTLYHDIGKSPHVQSRAQAVAIGLETQRRAAHGKATGGVAGYDDGGAVQEVIQALSQGAGSGVASATPASTTGAINTSNPAAPSSPTQTSATNNPVPTGMLPAPPATTNPAANSTPPVTQTGVVNNPIAQPLMKNGGALNRDVGGFSMANSPHLAPSWTMRAEARQMMHGPVISSVPGRTDNHAVKVPSGSYVLPSQHIASMGQGNSIAGLKAAHNLFGPGGPYGTSGLKIGRGNTMPKPPKPTRLFSSGGYSEGGARGGSDEYPPVPCNIAGGEYVIHPSVVKAIGHGSLSNGHKILDAYVMAARKKDIKTIQKLPPPAKD